MKVGHEGARIEVCEDIHTNPVPKPTKHQERCSKVEQDRLGVDTTLGIKGIPDQSSLPQEHGCQGDANGSQDCWIHGDNSVLHVCQNTNHNHTADQDCIPQPFLGGILALHNGLRNENRMYVSDDTKDTYANQADPAGVNSKPRPSRKDVTDGQNHPSDQSHLVIRREFLAFKTDFKDGRCSVASFHVFIVAACAFFLIIVSTGPTFWPYLLPFSIPLPGKPDNQENSQQ
mmetsp:Transcript_34291/g.71389  ORF Transcript_34291/g.71389 Transcript_34291/m.71389 type:complete len:230 (+) Transcript_34291:895-1584(+)